MATRESRHKQQNKHDQQYHSSAHIDLLFRRGFVIDAIAASGYRHGALMVARATCMPACERAATQGALMIAAETRKTCPVRWKSYMGEAHAQNNVLSTQLAYESGMR
jgi:hypothetical protein